LMVAAMHCQKEVADLLLNYGADPKIRNNHKRRAFDFAKNPYQCKWSPGDLKRFK